MNKKRLIITYVLCDFFTAAIAWALFFCFRKYNIDNELFDHFSSAIFNDSKFWITIIIYPVSWLLIHLFSGYHNKVYNKSRLKELSDTVLITFIGTLFFFFAFILDDIVNSSTDYLRYFIVLFLLQFCLTYICRLLITTNIANKIHSGKIGFNTILIGSDEIAFNIYNSIINQKNASGNFIIGYVKVSAGDADLLSSILPFLGYLEDIPKIVKEKHIEEIIIAIQNDKRKYIEKTILILNGHGNNVSLKIIPQIDDFLIRAVKASAVLYEPLISISSDYISPWQKYLKRFMDITVSTFALIILFPVYLFLAIGVKLSSEGPVFYLQERCGYKGKLFKIIKFRSMYIDSEKEGPCLSSKDDFRVTKFGKFMRKTRLDETPQFFNVLTGEMSLVGPRPERQYYIDKIVEKAPYYKLLQEVKPGITSWGQIKFGYAENVDEMIQRLKWDLLYIENMSIQIDIKILIYTVLIVLKRKGQ